MGKKSLDNIILEMKNVSKKFFTTDVETTAVNNVNLNVNKGDYAVILGPSGCGKSTLLSIMGLINTFDDGFYYFCGLNVKDQNRQHLAKLRNEHIGFIFQSFNLIDRMSVLDNVKLPLSCRKTYSDKEVDQLGRAALEQVGMHHRMLHYPPQLSGGQQQRVAIARAMIHKPSIIFADEPTGNLDSKSSEVAMELINNCHQNGTTICMVTHDNNLARYANKIIYMDEGKITSIVNQ